MKPDDTKLGTRAEIKNLNSIKAIGRAIEYEIKRQAKLLDSGERVIQETRRFDDNRGITKSMRSKEDAHDYRYFPEPDILQVNFTDEDLDKIKAAVPGNRIGDIGHTIQDYCEKRGYSVVREMWSWRGTQAPRRP